MDTIDINNQYCRDPFVSPTIKRLHKTPLRCKTHVKLFGVSPSSKFGRCLIGRRTKCKLCNDCESNIGDLIHYGFMLGSEWGFRY